MSDSYVGEIRMFGGNYAPVGWAFCNGQLLNISEFDVLFTLLGTTYGGDGISTFAVPDFRGRVVVHAGQNPTTGTNFQLGQIGGTENVTLSVSQLPAHTHLANGTLSNANSSVPTNAVWGFNENLNQYSSESANVNLSTSAIAVTGGNLPHDNMMPSLPINYIISLYGIYPSQP